MKLLTRIFPVHFQFIFLSRIPSKKAVSFFGPLFCMGNFRRRKKICMGNFVWKKFAPFFSPLKKKSLSAKKNHSVVFFFFCRRPFSIQVTHVFLQEL